MRQNTLIGLAVVTAVVGAAAIFVPAPQATALKPIETGPVFPTLKDWLGSATKLSVAGAGEATVTLTRAAPAAAGKPGDLPVAGWVLTDKGGYPVQESAVKPVLAALLALHETEAKTERPKLYDRLDVEDPASRKDAKSKLIELDNGSGANIVKLIVGRRRFAPVGGGADAIYVRKPEDERAWVAEPAFDIPADALGWIDKKIIDIDPDKIKTMTITPTGTPTGGAALVLERDKPGDKLQIRDLPKDATLRSDTAAADVAAGFRFLDLLDVRPATEIKNAATTSVDVVSTDGLHATVSLYDESGNAWLEVSATGEGDAAKQAEEITARTKGWAYKVTTSRAKLLGSKLADLLTPAPKPGADGAAPETSSPEAEPALPPAPPKGSALVPPKPIKPGK
jgi:Domain of unknown function (DUF4340)